MILTPKEILFEKTHFLNGGTDGPLFNSQRELAEIIMENKPGEFKNLHSLVSFLSQVLKTNKQGGSRPVPPKLKKAILDAADKRLANYPFESISNELDISFKYWSGDKDFTHYQNHTLIHDLKQSLMCQEVAVFSSSLIPFNYYNDLSKEIYSLFWEAAHKIPFTYYFPNLATAALFWNNLDNFMLKGTEEKLNPFLLKMNESRRIVTKIINPESCSVPLYCFFGWAKIDPAPTYRIAYNILSISSGEDCINHITYSHEDMSNIWNYRITPILENQDNNTGIREITYKELFSV